MRRIFFVEDDLSLISGLSFAIRKQGYEIDVARTKLEAETLWMNGTYDLVILDVSLPDGSGYDLCRKIRQTSKVPVIFLTAADEDVREIHKGDVMLFDGQYVVVFYQDFQTTYRYTRLGHVEAANDLDAALGAGDVFLTLQP